MVRAFGALLLILRRGFTIGAISRGPEARSIPAWGNAPGMERTTFLRAEGPTHPNGETVWRDFSASIGMMSHIRYV
jgi:hypothetical protein